ncbi:alpha-galactosidase, partial [Streptomyces bacillaris]|uniref:alpha-galactosidase n=1 Tax=Streptomyces bacillaris TaxID=68179 RepID=UPI0036DF7860
MRWPDGLHPIADHVRAKGMQFGLWIEPEMISADSDLARAHPDWLLTDSTGRMPLTWRHQQVLDLSNPDAYRHIHSTIDALLAEYPIDFLK